MTKKELDYIFRKMKEMDSFGYYGTWGILNDFIQKFGYGDAYKEWDDETKK